MWSVEFNGVAELLTPAGPATSVEHTFTAVGAHTVVAAEAAPAVPSSFLAALFGTSSDSNGSGAGAAPTVHAFTVASKAIRYELRDLSRADHEAYFDALVSFYAIGQVHKPCHDTLPRQTVGS
jgi:hypothetical protein